MSTKSPFEFVFSCCEFTKVILLSKSWCETFVLELSGIQIEFYICHIYRYIYNNKKIEFYQWCFFQAQFLFNMISSVSWIEEGFTSLSQFIPYTNLFKPSLIYIYQFIQDILMIFILSDTMNSLSVKWQVNFFSIFS